MKYIDTYFYPDVKPDEKEFKESIISQLCDIFIHENIIFVLAGINNLNIPISENTIVFLSGNEHSMVPAYQKFVKLIFTDFWIPTMPENMFEIPLGFNERTSGRFLSNPTSKPISERLIDISFIGSVHKNGANHRLDMLNQVSSLNKYTKHIDTYNSFFYEEQNIQHRQRTYEDILLNTKISLCPGGANTKQIGQFFSGWETYRFWESMRYQNIIICNYNWSKYYCGPNVYYINQWSELSENFIDEILKSKNLDNIQQRIPEYYRENSSRIKITKDITDIICNHI